VQKAHFVPAGAFWPVPEVDGGVLALHPQKPECALDDLERVVRTAFSSRRKTLRNTLKPLFSAPELQRHDIDPQARAETISPAAFARLANSLAAREAVAGNKAAAAAAENAAEKAGEGEEGA